MSARQTAPTVVSPRATKLIGPSGASDPGRLNTPTPMMVPSTNAVACGSPSPGSLLVPLREHRGVTPSWNRMAPS